MLLIGCTKRQLQTPDIPTENIDFFALNQKDIEDIPTKQLANVQYINLAIDRTDLLFSKIDKIQILNHRIYILDSYQKILGVFDTLGNDIRKVGNIDVRQKNI